MSKIEIRPADPDTSAEAFKKLLNKQFTESCMLEDGVQELKKFTAGGLKPGQVGAGKATNDANTKMAKDGSAIPDVGSNLDGQPASMGTNKPDTFAAKLPKTLKHTVA